jgi:hypothetical protein
MKGTGMKRGQPITFRLPSDTPDHVMKHLDNLKETERRNFSSKIAEFMMSGLDQSLSKHKETLTITLPKGLTKSQRDWLKHEHSHALLGSIVYNLLADPVRTASLYASINNSGIEMENYLGFNEEISATIESETEVHDIEVEPLENVKIEPSLSEGQNDDLDHFDWNSAMKANEDDHEEVVEEDMDSLLGDFLSQMNK